jgi:NAD(P)-dependent dehydrogenase (short-subunit alcohol dehydrogenase family)
MTGKVAIITTADARGVASGLVAGYRARGWAVVAAARTIGPSPDPDLLTIAGDIVDPATASRVVGGALNRFGRIDTLVNDAGFHLARPFTDYTRADYAAAEVSLAGFFWLTQRAIAEMATRYGGHVVSVLAARAARAARADLADSGAPAVLTALIRGSQVAATRSLAAEHASLGIRVNAVLPQGGQISDVVNAVLFLESSPGITGEIVHVGGRAG